MPFYEVINRRSGHSFGVYEAADEHAAIEACVKDAGYESVADMQETLGQQCELEAVVTLPVAVVKEHPTPKVLARFATIDEAERYIDELPDRAEVEAGGYGIDAPEAMVNPPRGGRPPATQSRTVDLIDAQQRHREHPTTFDVPSDEALAAIKPGDLVKVGFYTPEDGGERMWVEVTSVGADLRGKLDNTPVVFTSMRRGDEVAFERRHVLDLCVRTD